MSVCVYMIKFFFVMLYAGAMERTQIEQTIVLTDFSRGIGFFWNTINTMKYINMVRAPL